MAKIGLPAHMTAVALKSGVTAYYWTLPPWARKEREGRACPVKNQKLGNDLADAIARADGLNIALAEFRAGVSIAAPAGTVEWLFGWYRGLDRFTRLAFKTRRDYTRVMNAVCAVPTVKRTIGTIAAAKIDARAADKIAKARLKHGRREGRYAVQVCSRVWNEAVRHRRETKVTENPFGGMGMSTKAVKGNKAATRAQYDAYREAAHRLGVGSLAVAAAIRFELAQRGVDAFGFAYKGDPDTAGMKWAGYQPGERIAVGQHKLGDESDAETLPLATEDGAPLYPVLEHELALAMLGPYADPDGYIVVDELTGQRHTEDTLRRRHRAVIKAAGLPAYITPTSFRHGGITEIGDAGASVRAISRHRTDSMVRIYDKQNDEKARKAASTRAEYVKGKK